MDPAPPGWTRYLVKSTFGLGRDFAVLDLAERQVFVVDGQLGARPRATVQDADGTTVYTVTGKLLGFPREMVIASPSGAEAATIKAALFSPIKNRLTVHRADADDWELEGSLMEKEYGISAGGRPVAHITQKWLTVRDTYTVDVADGTDAALTLAVLWSVDGWFERK